MTDAQVVGKGRKVTLRGKRIEDAAEDYRWRTDPELAALDATTPLRISLREFERMLRDELLHPAPWVRRFAIDALDGTHIGNCMVYDIDTASGVAEVGIMVGERAYWDQGYGLEAMAYLVDQAFTIGALHCLYLHTMVWNHRARRAFAKCGFQEVREVRRSGYDFVRMELRRGDWGLIRGRLLCPGGSDAASPPSTS